MDIRYRAAPVRAFAAFNRPPRPDQALLADVFSNRTPDLGRVRAEPRTAETQGPPASTMTLHEPERASSPGHAASMWGNIPES